MGYVILVMGRMDSRHQSVRERPKNEEQMPQRASPRRKKIWYRKERKYAKHVQRRTKYERQAKCFDKESVAKREDVDSIYKNEKMK